MRFSRSTHLLMFLSLETLTSIIRTGLPILMELIDYYLADWDVLRDSLRDMYECLKESCFPDIWEVSMLVPLFKNVGERSTANN